MGFKTSAIFGDSDVMEGHVLVVVVTQDDTVASWHVKGRQQEHKGVDKHEVQSANKSPHSNDTSLFVINKKSYGKIET